MSTSPISSQTLDPIVIQIGVLVGLLKKESEDTYSLNESWFQNPWSYISKIPSNPEMFTLITTLMGSASGNALGTPTQTLNRTWYPVMNTSGAEPKPTGIYIVSGTPDGESQPELGIGSLYPWEYDDDKFIVLPYAYFPLFTLPDANGDGFNFVLGQPGHPVQLGVQVNGGNGYFSTGNGISSLSFDGFNAGVDVFFSEGMYPQLNLIFQNLKLPGETQGTNRSILDLIEQTSVQEWITVALSVLGSQLAQQQGVVGAAGKMINTLLELLGLLGPVPSINWEEIVNDPAATGRVLTQWIRSIASQPASLKTWLNAWYCLFNGLDASVSPDNVTGSGTRQDPFAVQILKLEITSTIVLYFDIGFATVTDTDNTLHFYPNVILRSQPILPLFGFNTFGVDIRSQVELFSFSVPSASSIQQIPVFELFPGLSLMATAANTEPNKPLFSVKDPLATSGSSATFSIDNMQVGFTYDRSAGSVSSVPTPNFNLINVQSSLGTWPVINLATFNEEAILEDIGPIVTSAINNFFGENNPYANAFESVLGISAPKGYSGTWPLQNELLLAPNELSLLIQNPFNALGAYYTRCLNTNDGSGKPLFSYLIPAFAVLMGSSANTVSGTGTASDPWCINILSIGTATMQFITWYNGTPPGNLSLALGFNVPVTFTGVSTESLILAELLQLELPASDGTGDWGGSWMQSTFTRLTLKGESGTTLSTPPLAGVTLQASSVFAEGGWRNNTGFYAQATIEALTLVGSTPISLGNLSFGTTDWSVDQLKQFAPAIVNGAGLLLLENGGRMGVTNAAILGLLPNIPSVIDGSTDKYDFPVPALALPSNWPIFTLTDYSNPWNDLLTQFSKIYAGESVMVIPALRMIGWTLTGQLPVEPSTQSGTINDPWQVQLLGAPVDFSLLTWLSGSGQTGFGISYPLLSEKLGDVAIAAAIRLDVPGFTVNTEIPANPGDVVYPRLVTYCTIANPNGQPLVKDDLSGITIGSVQVGFSAQFADGEISYYPVFTFLNSRVTTDGTLTTYELTQDGAGPQWFSPQGIVSFNALVNALMDTLSSTLNIANNTFPQLTAFIELLVDMHLVVPDTNVPPAYGFNRSAWDAMLANPGTYFSQYAINVLSNLALSVDFLNAVNTFLGISPALPGGMNSLLLSLGLFSEYGTTYVPNYRGLLDFVKDPQVYLANSVSTLFNDEGRLTALLTNLHTYAGEAGWFSINTGGDIVKIGILPQFPIVVGNELQLSAMVTIDLNAFSLSLNAAVCSVTLGSAVQYKYTPVFKNSQFTGEGIFSFTSWTDGSLPAAFPPLQIWPIPSNIQPTIAQLSVQVPVTLLSTFASKYLNTFATPQNPAVLNLFNVVGLTFSDQTGDIRIRPLEYIFMNPVQWMLSPSVVGNGSGGISLDKLGGLLYAIVNAAGISSGNVKLLPYSHEAKNDGVQLTGLPWGVNFILYSNDSEGVNFTGTFAPGFVAPMPVININAGLSFANGTGINISGTADLKFDFGTNSSGEAVQLGINTSYKKGSFSLGAVTTISGDDTIFELLPFGGLNQFISGATKVLLETIGDMLFSSYNAYILLNPYSSLKGFVENIENISGITSGVTLYNFFNKIASDPLSAFTPANIQGTISGMYTFVSNILLLNGFSISDDKNYLQYLINFSSLPQAKILVQVGIQAIEFSGVAKTVFGIWVKPQAQFEWITLGLDKTGIGVETPFNLSSPGIIYSANFTVGINPGAIGIEGMPSPTFLFGLNGTLTGEVDGPILQLFPVASSTADGTLRIDLLPNCKLVIVGREATSTQWLLAFGTDFLVPLVANMALSTTTVKGWLDNTKIGTVTGAPGLVLTSWGLLTKTPSGNYILSNLKTAFDASDPVSIVTKLIFSALDLLNGQCVVPINSKGIYVQSMADGDLTRYGLRVEIPDISVIDKKGTDGMNLVFQLGKFYANQTKDNNWTGIKSDPGLVSYFISRDKSGVLSFWPRFELLSVGFDFSGSNAQKPLVNLNGVTINAIKPRVLVVLDFLNGNVTTQFGAATMIDTIGIPLGPGFGSGSNSNPVAQNLLTSGGNPGKTDAINPAFLAAAAYVYNGSGFTFQLYTPDGVPTDKVIIPIMRAFGPLQCRKVGIGWENQPQLLDVYFDGSVSLAGLTADVQDLEIGIPVTNPTNFDGYKLDLAGLDISFKSGAVLISGGFLKDDSMGFIQYIGQAQIRASNFGLGAFGAYALVENNVSLFIFAYLNAPIGGPPYFFIKGLSGGFGYNRAINLPRADKVYSFPMVSGIDDSAQLGGKNGNPPTNTEALKALGTTIAPPQLGSYWLAAGIKFTSFELIDSQAMVVVQFGSDFMIGLLGLSGLVLPKTGYSYVGAQMAFTVTYRESTGLLAMEAVLTANSYVLSPECRLTGGMAFYVWFKNQIDTGAQAGEFVFTLGGYSDYFNKPAYFPDEPRLGFSWVMGDISIKGGAYFALTPSSVMAGGSLEALYKTGNLKAWFNAWADFLIMWKPFHFFITIGVNVGASYTIHFIWTTTFKVELGAELRLWGPPTAGSATIKWWVISFTVDFGDQSASRSAPAIIDWTQFKGNFLPQDQAPNPPPQQTPDGASLAVTNNDAQPKVQQVTQIRAITGIIQELDDAGSTLWQVSVNQFVFQVITVVPLNFVSYNGDTQRLIDSSVKFGIRPLGSVVLKSDDTGRRSLLSVSILYNNIALDASGFTFIESINGVPYSLWATVNDGKSSLDSKIIPDALVGLSSVQVVPKPLPPGPPMFPISNFTLQPLPDRALTLWNDPWLHPAVPAQTSDQSVIIIEQTVMTVPVPENRKAILDAVVSSGINVGTDGRLDMMAAYAAAVFQSFPMLGALGSLGIKTQQAQLKTFRRNKPQARKMMSQAQPAAASSLRAYTLQYPRPVLATSVFMAASGSDVKHMIPVKGELYLTGLDSGLEDSALLSGVLRGSDDETKKIQLLAGASALVDIDQTTKGTASISGNLPVYTVQFDENNQYLNSALLNDGDIYSLPAETAQSLFYGADTQNVTLPYALGWHVTYQLIQTNANALIGIGAVVIPQSPILISAGRHERDYGLIDGSDMIEQNNVENADGIARGSVLTLLPQSLQTAVILFTADDGNPIVPQEGDVVATICILKDGIVTYQSLQVYTLIQGYAENAVIFYLPAITSSVYELKAAAMPGWKLTGVLGLSETPDKVADSWKEIVLKPTVADSVTDVPNVFVNLETSSS